MRSDECRLSPEDLAEARAVQRQALAFRLQCRLDAMAERRVESVGISRPFATELVQALTAPSAPGGEAAQAAETGAGSAVGEHPVARGQAPDLTALQAENERLKGQARANLTLLNAALKHVAATNTALAESERKRREADQLLMLRTRQNSQASEAWARAAERALAGYPAALRDKVAWWRDPARLTATIAQSAPAQETFHVKS